jgi:Zn-dependent M28 family amino/carboxypeptidase
LAAKAGAVGALIRSVGTGAYRLAHTGAMAYEDATPKIPFAAVSAEDADLLHRLLAGGKQAVNVRMKMGCEKLPDQPSSNVVGEIPGTELPSEIVLLAAHLDSWDLGTGAIDDGAGCAIMLEAARLIRAAGGARRTIRVVLFMNEEQGTSGGRAYTERHRAEMDKHVAAIEADEGGARPLGFSLVGDEPALGMLRAITAPLETIRAQAVTQAHFAGADITGLQVSGVPSIGLSNDMTNYFDWHHTAADTVDKLDREELALSVAAVTVVAQGLADAKHTLPRTPAASRELPSWAR